MDFEDYHKLHLDDTVVGRLIANPWELGLTEEDLRGKTRRQVAELVIGEHFARLAKHCGQVASRHLFSAQWEHTTPEWFDHRHHLLDPDRFFSDFWAALADNMLMMLPLGGTILDLCSGDGFYAYYFYRRRAKEVVCIDNNSEVHRLALRHHRAPNIAYHLRDVLAFEPPASHFDVVGVRGAIEHFSQSEQQEIFRKALRSLKPGGWFCGDTPANPDRDARKGLASHEYEWVDEDEMRAELQCVFDHIETHTLHSSDRTTLFWRCRKASP